MEAKQVDIITSLASTYIIIIIGREGIIAKNVTQGYNYTKLNIPISTHTSAIKDGDSFIDRKSMNIISDQSLIATW